MANLFQSLRRNRRPHMGRQVPRPSGRGLRFRAVWLAIHRRDTWERRSAGWNAGLHGEEQVRVTPNSGYVRK
jgi:hypothetical protein